MRFLSTQIGIGEEWMPLASTECTASHQTKTRKGRSTHTHDDVDVSFVDAVDVHVHAVDDGYVMHLL